MQNTEKALLKSLIHVIWADGEVSSEEQRLLHGILNQLQLDAAEKREVAEMLADQPPRMEDLRQLAGDMEGRKEIMKVLLAMAMADGHIELTEIRFLEKIARNLEISDADLEQLRNETLQETEGGLA